MPINASSLLVGTERRRARRTYVATLHAKIPTSIQLTGFAIEVDPSPIWNWPMSALGQKRTYAVQKDMSALPRIATAKADIRKRSCPLCPQKRTCAVQLQMSALGQ